MAVFRQRLRVFALAWLVFQAASFSAVVPRDCCAAHRPAAKSCHEPQPATHCPMQASNGARCPMHRGHDGGESPACQLRGSCGGPMSALVTLLATHGILSDPPSISPAIDAQIVSAIDAERLVAKRTPPDPPPPRA